MKKHLPWLIIGILVVLAGFLYRSQAVLLSDLEGRKAEVKILEKKIESLSEKPVQPASSQTPSVQDLLQGVMQEVAQESEDPKSAIDFPRIEVEPKVYDFGTIQKSDGVVTANFTLKNAGGSPLLVNRIFTSCGCTTSTFESQTLEPGKSTIIQVDYDPNYLGEYYDLGEVEKKISVISNDPKNLFYRATLKANVLP